MMRRDGRIPGSTGKAAIAGASTVSVMRSCTIDGMARRGQGPRQHSDAFRCELREAVQTEDVGRVVTVCENILKWGGVAAHNVRYLHRQQPVLVRELQHVRDLLSRNCTPSKRDLCREPDNPATECRMNAGFVKIYSLLCDDCVIYDGRVGAALGLLTRQFCEATSRTEVPLRAGIRLRHAEGGTEHDKRQGARPESRHPAVFEAATGCPIPHRSGDAGKLVRAPRAGAPSTRLQRWRGRIP